MAEFTGSPGMAEPYASQVGPNKANKTDVALTMRTTPFSYTHILGAGTGEINLLTIPAGRIRVFPQESRISMSQFAVNADFHLGHRAYRTHEGVLVPQDDDEWMANVDVGGGVIASTVWASVVGATLLLDQEYDTVDGLTIYMMVDTANIEDGDTVRGYVRWGRL